ALAAPPERLEEVAARVSRDPSINHNYQREHRYNLWFVVTAASRAHLDEVVAGIERDTGCAVIVLPLEEEFHIDLGFDLKAGEQGRRPHAGARAAEIGRASGRERVYRRGVASAREKRRDMRGRR